MSNTAVAIVAIVFVILGIVLPLATAIWRRAIFEDGRAVYQADDPRAFRQGLIRLVLTIVAGICILISMGSAFRLFDAQVDEVLLGGISFVSMGLIIVTRLLDVFRTGTIDAGDYILQSKDPDYWFLIVAGFLVIILFGSVGVFLIIRSFI